MSNQKTSEFLQAVLEYHNRNHYQTMIDCLTGKPNALEDFKQGGDDLQQKYSHYVWEAQALLELYPFQSIPSPSNPRWDAQASAVLYTAIRLAEGKGD
ncbi:MAG TPA: hypothetical protein PK671_15830 [Candidatus Obscuribacter sp.]|nr:hypothetical protein [Candidatus Obscuribacter sp.]